MLADEPATAIAAPIPHINRPGGGEVGDGVGMTGAQWLIQDLGAAQGRADAQQMLQVLTGVATRKGDGGTG